MKINETTLTSKGFFPVEKTIVACGNDTEDMIARLRATLAGGGSIEVNQDGTVYNPSDDMTKSSVANGEGFKTVEKAVVACGNDTEDMISKLRTILEGGGSIEVNQDGTVYNPSDDMTKSSVANGEGFKPVEKTIVASQWYQLNPALQKAEIMAMKDIHPDAKMGYMPNGDMYWIITIQPVVCGKRKKWSFLAVYDSDHPQARWGGSVKFYPVAPNYAEMQEMVNRSFVTPKSIPHTLRDDNRQIYLCTQHMNNIHHGQHKGELITTAASCLRYAMRWVTVFELGLIDQETWDLFQDHGKI